MRKALTNIFNRAGDMKVIAEARDAEEVFRQIDSQNADVLVLDLNMPGKNGLEILKQLQQTGSDLPVVVLTLFPNKKFKNEAMRLGARDFLTKDCDPNDLISAVRKAKNRAG